MIQSLKAAESQVAKFINKFNPLMPVGNKKVTLLSAAGMFKYVGPFCYHQG